jgi:hypothetical protein
MRFKHWLEDKLELLSVGAPLQVGPTATCALGIHHQWDAEQIMVMILTAYADESGTHSPEYQMLAGYVSTLGQWNVFDRKWKKRLAREGLSYFHSVEHTRKRSLQPMCLDLLALCGKHIKLGFVIRLDKPVYDEIYIGRIRPKDYQLDTMYSICYRYMIGFFIRELPSLLNRDDFYINTILELGAKGSRDSLRIHKKITEDLPHETRMIGAPTFGEKKKFPGLQAADSLAHPAFREENTELEKIPFPTGDLRDARKITDQRLMTPPTFYVRLEENHLRELKTDILYRVGVEQKFEAAIAPFILRGRAS